MYGLLSNAPCLLTLFVSCCVQAYFAMGSAFNSAAYAASGASLLVSITYVLRLLEFQSDEPDRTVSIKSREISPCVAHLRASFTTSLNYVFFFWMAGAN